MRIETVNPQTTGPVAGQPASPVGAVSAADPVRRAVVDPPLARAKVEDEVAAALRRYVPRQGSPSALLANLAWLATTTDGNRAALPARLRGALRELWEAVCEVEELAVPGRLERACRDSGAQLEWRLLAAAPAELEAALQRDWKALLLRLRALLAEASPRLPPAGHEVRPAPPPGQPGPLAPLLREPATLPGLAGPGLAAQELRRQVSDALARITCGQLTSIPGEAGIAAPYFELPLRRAGEAAMVRVRMHREAQPRPGGGPGWRLEFALDLGRAGTLHGVVRERSGRLDVVLEAGSVAYATALQEGAPRLERSLAALGLDLGQRAIRTAAAREAPADRSWLVDLHA